MKIVLILVILFGFNQLNAQEVIQQQQQIGYHQHDGFYLSMSIGPLLGRVTTNGLNKNSTNKYSVDRSGTGVAVDLKIGSEVRENLLLHVTVISNLLQSPSVKTSFPYSSSTTIKSPHSYIVGETMAGVGLTNYLMPSNILISGTLGIGVFTFTDYNDSRNNSSTKPGISIQLKLGKEWWISKNWGMGVGLTYNRTTSNLRDSDGDIAAEYESRRFGILLNTTFN